MSPKEVMQSLKGITSSLIEIGLSEAQNFPSIRTNGANDVVSFEKYNDISIALKNVSYEQIYNELEASRQYNIKLLDGGLLQFLYFFENNSLIKHRLAYYPSPSYESFQNDPELYLDDSNYYADMIAKNIIPVPVRFDFAPEDASPVVHPSSHLSLGDYKNCRIPVSSPICPGTFANFILSSFYHNASLELPEKFNTCEIERTIHDNEKSILHLNIEHF